MFFPHTALLWNNLPKNVKRKDLTDFKLYIKTELKYFARGKKIFKISFNKNQSRKIWLKPTQIYNWPYWMPSVRLSFKEESPSHYFLDCFLYLPERQILFDLFEHFIPNFKTFTKKKKLNIILRGINTENEEFISTNTTLKIAVQNVWLG